VVKKSDKLWESPIDKAEAEAVLRDILMGQGRAADYDRLSVLFHLPAQQSATCGACYVCRLVTFVWVR
jgi:hypothetical protein